MSERFTTPVGRFIQGDPFEPQTKDMQGNPRVVKSGPNMGQPNPQYFVALAIPKTPGVTDWKQEPDPFFQTVLRVAQASFPDGKWQWPQFAWKIVDGDSTAMNQRGRAWNTIEGYAGHWVCRFASSFPPKCFARPNYAATDQITDRNRIKRGHYLTVNGSCEGNRDTNKPGTYLNLDLVSWEGFGPEIVGGPDANEAFAQAPALPAGASATPVVPAAAPAPVAAPASVAPVAPVAAPAAVAPAPYTGFMAPPAPPAPVNTAVPARQMLPAAGGATYEQMIAAGWTDVTLLQHGMMVA
jgi:hypothetical protein